jgi:hypothetical protein
MPATFFRNGDWRSTMSYEPEQYDIRQPFDLDTLLDGFGVEKHQVRVDPDSPLGREMAAARAAWAEHSVPDPNDLHVELVLVSSFNE